MNADSNVETIKAIYESFGRGDVAAILDSCTDDVDWTTEAAGDDAPWWGQRIGKEAVSGFFTAITDATEVTEFHSAQLRRQRHRGDGSPAVRFPQPRHGQGGNDESAPLLALSRREGGVRAQL